MTLQVKISHDQPGYPKDVHIRICDETGKPRDGTPDIIVTDGQAAQLYIYPGQSLHISEGPERPGLAVVSEGHAAVSQFGGLEGAVDIPIGESEVITPSQVGHLSSLFGPLGSGR